MIWAEIKADFLKYLQSIDYKKRTIVKVVNQLDREVSVINEPFDIIKLFSKVKHSRRNMILGLRKMFTFYELNGVDKAYLDSLRAALPKVRCGIDLKVPEEAKIIESLKKLPNAPVEVSSALQRALRFGFEAR